jgi:hypothetical protein
MANRPVPHARPAVCNVILRVWRALPLRLTISQKPMRAHAVVDDPGW